MGEEGRGCVFIFALNMFNLRQKKTAINFRYILNTTGIEVLALIGENYRSHNS